MSWRLRMTVDFDSDSDHDSHQDRRHDSRDDGSQSRPIPSPAAATTWPSAMPPSLGGMRWCQHGPEARLAQPGDRPLEQVPILEAAAGQRDARVAGKAGDVHDAPRRAHCGSAPRSRRPAFRAARPPAPRRPAGPSRRPSAAHRARARVTRGGRSTRRDVQRIRRLAGVIGRARTRVPSRPVPRSATTLAQPRKRAPRHRTAARRCEVSGVLTPRSIMRVSTRSSRSSKGRQAGTTPLCLQGRGRSSFPSAPASAARRAETDSDRVQQPERRSGAVP